MTNCIRRERSYWTLCRCPTCVVDTARKRKLQSLGYRRRVTHDQAWAILADKFDAGWSALAVSSAVGLDDDYFSRHIARWRRGEECLIGPATAEAIVTMGRPTKGQVGAIPSRRRLQALGAIGYGLNTLAAETGVNFSTLAAIRNGNDRVSARIANTITDTYERLHMIPGGDEQAHRIAREKGWAPPLAWNDIDTDDNPRGVGWKPRVEGDRYRGHDYDETVVERILGGDYDTPSTPVEKTAVCARWVAMGRSLNELERRTGWRPSRYYKGDAA